MKRRTNILFLLVFICILSFQYYRNLNLRVQPPSKSWSKEVLISEGNIHQTPAVIKWNDSYIAAHDDGDKIKIIAVDAVGKKIREKSFKANTREPRSIHVITNDSFLYLSWLTYEDGKNQLQLYKLDKKFSLIDKEVIPNANEVIQVGDHLMALSYNDRIEVIDLKLQKKSVVQISRPSLLMGTVFKDRFVIAYMQGYGDFRYFYVKDGVSTSPKTAGTMKEMSRVAFYSAAITMSEKKGYILGEYKYMDTYSSGKLLEFSLDHQEYKFTDLANNALFSDIFNVTSYPNSIGPGFIAGGERQYGKKERYIDIMELVIHNGKIEKGACLSRSKAMSMFPSCYGDTAVFCDFQTANKANLYMVSKNTVFKAANNSSRFSEYILAASDTLQDFIFSIVDVIGYGVLWIIPALCIVSFLCVIEYKIGDFRRKKVFLLVYAAISLIKLYYIYQISYKRYAYFLPAGFTFTIGMLLSSIISLISSLYGYQHYVKDMEHNVAAISIMPALLIDTLLTQLIFVPFMM